MCLFWVIVKNLVVVELLMYIYVGKCSDGKYWFIKSTFIYFVNQKGRAHVFAKMTDVTKSKMLWESLPREVRNVLQRLGVRYCPSRRGNVVDVDKVVVDKDFLDLVSKVFFFTSYFVDYLHGGLCPKCGRKAQGVWEKIIVKYLVKYWNDDVNILNEPFSLFQHMYKRVLEVMRD